MNLARRIGIGCLALAVLGGGGCVTEPEGTITFVGSCSRAGTITASIDGAQVGTLTGTTSASFPVSAGSHTASARATGVTWPSRTFDVKPKTSNSFLLLCI
jgi:hypothetical protein